MYINKNQIYGNLRRTAVRGLISVLDIKLINHLAQKHFSKIEDGKMVLTCPYSGISIYDENDAILEHIIPVKSGGGTVLFNCIPAHVSINNHNQKGNKHLLEWWLNSEHFSYDRLEHLLDYIFEAYDITFSMYTSEEIAQSFETFLNNELNDDIMDFEAEELDINEEYNSSLIDYHQLLVECIKELEIGGYDVEKYRMKLQSLTENGIFGEIQRYEEVQGILKQIIIETTGLNNRYELTVLLNIDTTSLLKTLDTSLSIEEIKIILTKRIRDIEKLMISNNLSIFNYFDNIKDLSMFLEKNMDDFSQDEIEKLISECRYSWDKGYSFALRYFEKHGDLNVPASFCTKNGYDYDADGYTLGTWIKAQRQARKQQGTYIITEEQIEKLNRIKMTWEPFKEKWEEMFALAEAYYNYYHNLNVSYNFKTVNGYDYDENGKNLGRWITKQRESKRGTGHGALNPEQAKRLELIGMMWNPIQDNWNKMYLLTEKYKEIHGDLMIPVSFITKDGINQSTDGESLGRWIVSQREKYRSNVNNYRESIEAKKLELLGIKGNVIDEQRREQFEFMFKLAEQYYEHHGNLNVPKRFKTINGYEKNEKGENLGTWIVTQRIKYKSVQPGKGLLDEEHIRRLESIGMIWDPLENDWNRMYGLAQKYYEHHGDLNMPVRFCTKDGVNIDDSGENLGRWLGVQRRRYMANDLSQERIDKLEALHMVWDVKSVEWDNMYNLSKIFYENYNHLNIPQRFKTKDGISYDESGVALGSWICTQRKALISGKITEDKVKKLNDIGMLWSIARKDKKTVAPELGGKSNARRSA